MMSYQQTDKPQPFHPLTSNHQPPLLQPPLLHSMNISSHQSQPPLQSTDTKNSSRRTTCLQSVHFRNTAVKHLKIPFQDHPNLPKTVYSCCLKENSPNKTHSLNTMSPNIKTENTKAIKLWPTPKFKFIKKNQNTL